MPKKQLEYSIDLPVSIEHAWQVLTDFAAYPQWNSMISFNGEPAIGKKVPMRVEIRGRKIVTPVKFLRMDNQSPKQKELAWIGGPAPLFTGEHYFILESVDENNCKLIQGENFNGWFVNMMWPFLEKTLIKLYQQSNQDMLAAVQSAS